MHKSFIQVCIILSLICLSSFAQGKTFNLDPALSDYVSEVGLKVAKSSERSDLPFEFTIENSSMPNAWALPSGKIAITRGLLVHLNNEAELAAILGHEIRHVAGGHFAKRAKRQIILTPGIAASLSRADELEADAYGMQYMVKAGYNPAAAVSVQKTLGNLYKHKTSNGVKSLIASHPTTKERVARNTLNAQTMPKNLDFGQERYQQKIASLKAKKKAYDEFDKGVRALRKKDMSLALKDADLAIKLEPKEALFYVLRGDILSKMHQFEGALRAYNQAIFLDRSDYYYYQQRGQLLKKMGRKSEGRKDLTISKKLKSGKQPQIT